jgi:hypothetical protein
MGECACLCAAKVRKYPCHLYNLTEMSVTPAVNPCISDIATHPSQTWNNFSVCVKCYILPLNMASKHKVDVMKRRVVGC